MIGQTVSHYRILEKLGEGGMGVVYKAEDTKLDRVVALKFLAPELTRDEAAKARFMQEAKAASALDHPNICTIYEVDESRDGRLFIAMAYYEGDSLRDVIARGPLEPEGAVAIAQQVVQGLTQAHERGIIHRDIKPGNVLIAADGLVKVVDFGLAKLAGQSRITQSGATVGTLAFMAPEQVQGEETDGRADIWSVGVTLYEMVTGQLPFRGDRQQAMGYSIVNEEPIPASDRVAGVSPELERLIETCIRKSPAERYQNLADLLADLQSIGKLLASVADGVEAPTLTDLTVRLTVHPYPGLASFTEAEAAYFHGRESEVEAMWDKLHRQTLLAIIGPSGTGKSSFLRAGLMPSRPSGWGIVVCAPGSSPFLSLRQALVPELAGDTEAIRDLLGEDHLEAIVSTVARWRRRHGEALLILDQFEELFTLNPPEVQKQYTELLGRLIKESGVRILLSMRDDFLFHCHAHPALEGILESLTLLGPLTGAELRSALTQPAAHLGYHFEDEALADEMLAEVEGERGALPLLAFAMSRLWDRRDRERRLLTRRAYKEIGGVEGALAQHAEAVMERTGLERQAIVRELFRNLVTAQVTRVAREREELLSLFDESQREDAAEILRQLIHARLLTSFDVPCEDGEDSHRVEIVHESLLSSWPRLVRWQTQDADSAQFHDQVRQAADMWDGKNRADDLLWSGTLYNEFVLWHDRYPGGLTDTESEFSRAMTDKARQKKRRRVAVVVGGFVALVVVLAGVTSLWQRSQVSERRATAEARRAEANLLAGLGREKAGQDRTVAVAYALASLELEDSRDVRRFALENLAPAPLYSRIPRKGARNPLSSDISPDGKYLATGWTRKGDVVVYTVGSDSVRHYRAHKHGMVNWLRFNHDGSRLVTAGDDSTTRVWSVPDGELLSTARWDTWPIAFWTSDPDRLLVRQEAIGKQFAWYYWTPSDGGHEYIGQEGPQGTDNERAYTSVTDDGRLMVDWNEKTLNLCDFENLEAPMKLAVHDSPIMDAEIAPLGEHAASVDTEGLCNVWKLAGGTADLERQVRCPDGENFLKFSPDGDRLAAFWKAGAGAIRIWDLEAPAHVDPLVLQLPVHWVFSADFTDDGRWLVATSTGARISAWPLVNRYPLVLRDEAGYSGISLLPDGRGLVTNGLWNKVWLKTFDEKGPDSGRLLFTAPNDVTDIAVDPTGSYLVVAVKYNKISVVSLDDLSVRELENPPPLLGGIQFSPDSRVVGVIAQKANTTADLLPPCFWDLASGERLELGRSDEPSGAFRLTTDGRLAMWSNGRLESWNLDGGDHRVLLENADLLVTLIGRTGRKLIYEEDDRVFALDLESNERFELFDLSVDPRAMDIDSEDKWLAVGCFSGDVLLVPVTGGDAHLLIGVHDRLVTSVEFDPLGRYLASTSKGRELCLWPLPEGRPLMSYDHGEFLDYLRSQTNVRVAPDTSSATGFAVTHELFKGWDAVPQR